MLPVAEPPPRGLAAEGVAISVRRRTRNAAVAPALALPIAISVLAWGYTIRLADHCAAAETMLRAQTRPWTAAELGMTFVMWGVMMVAMMAPAAAPMLLALDRIGRARPTPSGPLLPATAFLLGYLLVWTGVSLVATLAQWRLHELALVSASGASDSAVLGGLLLLVAGAFQLTPLKQVCLRQCRSPLFFLLSAWRPGSWGALRMGALHGGFCVGCCWALMALMFVGGTMNLLWAAALMALTLAEKVLPLGRRVAHAAGAGLVAWGTYVLGAGLIRP